MALLDFLKRKKQVEKSKKPAQPVVTEKKSEKPLVEKKPEKEVKKPIIAGKVKGFSYEAIQKPHISEKASYLAEKNQYVFVVSSRANKTEIKKSVEGLYNVKVTSVNVIKIPSKKRRMGKIEGFKKGYKKAVVTVKEGQKLKLFSYYENL